MKRIFYFPFFAILFLPFCGHREMERPICISKAEINLHVQSESLRVAVERGLQALEEPSPAPVKKAAPTQSISPVKASDPIPK